jgi:MvaI/BcnI restriction endonuclease family protein
LKLPEIDLPAKLLELKNRGWIKSHRKSDTGIGKTVEDLLGIKENNQGEADCTYRGNEIEIKGHRVGSSSMITLFTLEAGIRHLNDVQLMRKYGYTNGKGRQALKITLTTQSLTPQGLKLKSDAEKGTISIVDGNGENLWVWTTRDIRLKLHNLCLVYAESKKEGEDEYFRIQSAVLAIGLDDRCFFKLVDQGSVKIDLRMHVKESGSSRNRGTAFRFPRWEDLVKCYLTQLTIL